MQQCNTRTTAVINILEQTRSHSQQTLDRLFSYLLCESPNKVLPNVYGGYTYLHLAALHRHYRAAALLVMCGNNTDDTDNAGDTPANVACDAAADSSSVQQHRSAVFWDIVSQSCHPLQIAYISNNLDAAFVLLLKRQMTLQSCSYSIVQRVLNRSKFVSPALHACLKLWSPTSKATQVKPHGFQQTLFTVLLVANRLSQDTTMHLPLELWFLILKITPPIA